jgi:TnpA family transposase
MKIPDALASVVDATLQLDCINEEWDELLRISASISNGTVSAVQVLDRFGSLDVVANSNGIGGTQIEWNRFSAGGSPSR